MSIERLFADKEDEWGNTAPAKGNEASRDDVPDGDYEMEITSARVIEKDEDLLIIYNMVVLGPVNAGLNHVKFSAMKDAQNMSYVKRELFKLGLECARLSDMQHVLNEAAGMQVAVTLKTAKNNKYQNTYFNRLLKPAGEAKSSEVKDPGGDSLPF